MSDGSGTKIPHPWRSYIFRKPSKRSKPKRNVLGETLLKWQERAEVALRSSSNDFTWKQTMWSAEAGLHFAVRELAPVP